MIALAQEASLRIYALPCVTTAPIRVLVALVHVDAIPCVSVVRISRVTLALEAWLAVDADAARAAEVAVISALVNVDADVFVGVELVALVAQVVTLDRFEIDVRYVQAVVRAYRYRNEIL